MKVRDLISALKGLEDNEVLIGSDEELNALYDKPEIGLLEKGTIVIYGLSGSEQIA